MIEVYTDGGSRNTGNKKGQRVKETDLSAWAYYIVSSTFDLEEKYGKSFLGYTNNQMELAGFISALKRLKALNLNKEDIVCYLDSKYVLQGVTEWLDNWVNNNYRSSTGKEIKNKRYWQAVQALLPEFPHLSFSWVKGHAHTKGNLIVDELLNQKMDEHIR